MPSEVPGDGEHVDFSSIRSDPSTGEVPNGLSCDARWAVMRLLLWVNVFLHKIRSIITDCVQLAPLR
jgi:hypothetical protein